MLKTIRTTVLALTSAIAIGSAIAADDMPQEIKTAVVLEAQNLACGTTNVVNDKDGTALELAVWLVDEIQDEADFCLRVGIWREYTQQTAHAE